MDNKVRKILEKLEDNGFEAYIIGGFVRDFLLGIESTDIDICTNALPRDVVEIFPNANAANYGSVSFKVSKYSIDITTYRSEDNYENRRPGKIEYVDNLLTDIKRRDFTINSICMNSSGTIIDLLNGKEDINKHIIKVIGPVEKKLSEDPLRMLRAVRFAIILDFNIDEEILIFINYHKKLLKELSFFRKEEELNRILSSKNTLKGLRLLKELDLLDALDISYSDNIVIVNDILGMWAQIDYHEEYPFNRNSQEAILVIREIIAKGEIDNLTLFNHGLYLSTVAGEILGIDRNEISNRHAKISLKSINDLAIKKKDIFEILDIKPSPKVRIIMDDILMQILEDNLINNYDIIKEYLLKKWK